MRDHVPGLRLGFKSRLERMGAFAVYDQIYYTSQHDSRPKRARSRTWSVSLDIP